MHKYHLNTAVIWPEERGTKRCGKMLSRWPTLPPEALLFVCFIFAQALSWIVTKKQRDHGWQCHAGSPAIHNGYRPMGKNQYQLKRGVDSIHQNQRSEATIDGSPKAWPKTRRGTPSLFFPATDSARRLGQKPLKPPQRDTVIHIKRSFVLFRPYPYRTRWKNRPKVQPPVVPSFITQAPSYISVFNRKFTVKTNVHSCIFMKKTDQL